MDKITSATRYSEINGLVSSLLYLLTLIYIFTWFTIIPNTRTKILNNVFGTIIAQVLSRLIIYLNQLLKESETGIAYTPIVCEICYIILEWSYTAMWTWLLLEGIYQQNLSSNRPLKEFQNYYYYLAWGMPIVFTILWVAFTLQNYNNGNWFGFNFEKTFWIMQTPQLLVIVNNIVILVFILKELYSKIQENKENTEKIKISIKATWILILLLITINTFNISEVPVGRTPWKLYIWSFQKFFLRIFQGAFLAIYYCFLNGVVRGTLKRKAKKITFFGDINDRFANKKRENTRIDILAVEPNMPFLVKPVPPPPFFRIIAEGVPTTKQKCGCAPRFDIHESNCLFAQPSQFDLNDDQDVNTAPQDDDMIQDNGNEYILPPPIPTKKSSSGIQVEEIVLKMVICADIHKPSTRLLSVEMTELDDTELDETTV